MKKILIFFFILTPLFCSAEQEMNYTVLPNLAYLSTLKVENEIQILEGLLPILIEDFAKDLNLSATPIPFSTAKEAREAAQKGSSPDVSSIDLIGGVYYDENTAQYMEYIYPAIYEDELLVVVPDKVKTKIYSLEDFQKLDVSLTAVVIDDFPLGSWWSQLIKDKNSRWREYVVTDNENYASPLKVEKVDSINEAMALVLKGTHYFVGSNLMLRDFLDRYPKVIHQINGQYIRTKGDKITRPIFIAVNRDFLDLSDSDFEQKLSEKISEMKESGEIEKLLLESKVLFRGN